MSTLAASVRRTCWLYSLREKLVDYDAARRWQLDLRDARARQYRGGGAPEPGRSLPDVLILLSHSPVYTLGVGARPETHLRFDRAAPPARVVRTERGGDVTYHGPGQLVGYPVLDLRRHRRDLRWYVGTLEQVLIETLAHYGVPGKRMRGLTGVWVGDDVKVAAIGVSASRWITCHGFALNVEPRVLPPFEQIVPCGIRDRRVGCVQQYAPHASMDDMRRVLAAKFADAFGLVDVL